MIAKKKRTAAPKNTKRGSKALVKAVKSSSKLRKSIGGNTSRDHIHRIFVIFSELQNLRFPTLGKLARLCEVDRRTIQRDIDQMNGLLGSFDDAHSENEILFDHARGGYKLLRELSHFPIVHIEDRDLLTLHFLRQCLEPYRETGIGRSMIDSFNHTFGILTGTTDWKKWERAVHFRFEGKPEIGKEDVRLFEILHRAIREHLRVSLDYKPVKESKVTRLVEPQFLFMRNGSWYLHAVKARTDERRTLKFARITNAHLTGESFPASVADPKERFQYSFGVVPSCQKPRQPVVIEFNESAGQRAAETLWHPQQKVSHLAGGRVRLELPFAEPTFLELHPWILSWGASAKVISPRDLRDTIAEKARSLAASYG